MSIGLVDILDVKPAWQSRHTIKALAKDGKSLAVKGLADLKAVHPNDYKKIMKVIRLVAENDRVQNADHVKQGKQHNDVYEMRGGQARLFFFYTPDAKQVVVCTNYYWKAKKSEDEQDAAFERCEKLRAAYLKSIE
ncbi:MAG TPA: type II toxin-antitoxin system RelE/ParE family toxin [Candidatus Hydrogenedentes bacterium]|nr:type II toxin-antitoxin system RelE/ParE family toxin [Candidatus Hydrogenedentota bacterium]